MPKKKIYLFANWKMYLDLKESITMSKFYLKEMKNLSSKDFVLSVFPSALAFKEVADVFVDSNINLGAQNTYWLEKGGYTGEVSAKMYANVGCKYVLVGHSERRHKFGENDEDVRKKIEAVLEAKMTPVLCVGETAVQRKKGLTDEIVNTQLKKAYQGLKWNKKKVIVAYEPVWAISANNSGKFCSVFEAEKEHQRIRKIVSKLLKIEPIVLFGGSVRPENIQEYISNPQIDGVLIGGASVKVKSWLGIIKKIKKQS